MLSACISWCERIDINGGVALAQKKPKVEERCSCSAPAGSHTCRHAAAQREGGGSCRAAPDKPPIAF
jgi:hypothetical protein